MFRKSTNIVVKKQVTIKSINLKQRTHTMFAENWHFMNKCIKLCNISSYPHFDDVVYRFTDCCLLAERAAAVSHSHSSARSLLIGVGAGIVWALELVTKAFLAF